MSEEELKEFDKVRTACWGFPYVMADRYWQLMDEPDWDIYYWATCKRAVPERWENSHILSRLREHARNEGKVIRRMPGLYDGQKLG